MDMFIFASPAMLLVVIYNAKENVVIRLRHNQFSIHFTILIYCMEMQSYPLYRTRSMILLE